MKKNNKFLFTIISISVLIASITTFVSFSSNVDTQEVVIKSITPVYDSTSTIEVDNNNVVFNDKNQVVEYKVVIENTQNYDIKINEITLSTPTEEFLTYEVKNIEENDVLTANSTKELTIYLETTGIKGWGRNFNDELIANISFDKVSKIEEIIPPTEDKEEVKQPEKPTQSIQEVLNNSDKIEIESINGSTIEFKDEIKVPEGENVETWIYPETEFYGYKEVDESRLIKEITLEKEKLNDLNIKSGEHNVVLSTEDKEVLGYVNVYINDNKDLSQESPEDGKIENPYTSGYGLLTLALSVSGTVVVGIFLFSRKKPIKYIVLILALSSTLTLVKAEESINLSISFNVNFKSQNVMKAAYTTDAQGTNVYQYYWEYATQISNFYISNEPIEIEEYEYVFDVTEEQNERVVAYLVENTENSGYYDAYLIADGMIYPNDNSSYYFYNMTKLKQISGLDNLDTSEVINMNYMFRNTGYNSESFELNLTMLDTSNVTSMSGMFYYTGYNASELIIDISEINTSKVRNMSGMFYGAGGASQHVEIDLYGINTSEVTNMKAMFTLAAQSANELVLDVSGLNTSSVINMAGMFHSLGKMDKDFQVNLSNFDTRNVTDMSQMFINYGYSSDELTLDLSNFDTSNVTTMRGMFNAFGKEAGRVVLNLSSFDTSKVTNMNHMFAKACQFCESFSFDISSFDTSKVTDMTAMLGAVGNQDPNFELDTSMIDFSSVETVETMFYQTGQTSSKFQTSITINNPNITNYTMMFTSAAQKDGSQIKVNYTAETEELVNKMIATKSSNSNVVKGNLIVDVDNLSIGDEIHISGEKFNVISQTDDTITMLAQQNLDYLEYKQTSVQNNLTFSNAAGWEYAPGPKEIDIQTWSTNPKKYVNTYIEYLQKELGDTSITGNLISLKELADLGCTIQDDYSSKDGEKCAKSPHKSWIINGGTWWTRSTSPDNSNSVWIVYDVGDLSYNAYNAEYVGIRPTITVSKDTLKNLNS